MWASPMTRPSLRWKASGDGGTWTGERATRRRGDYSSVRMLGEATEIGFAHGSSTCSNWRIRSRSRSRSVTTLREPAVEQDRASAILVYQFELERRAADQL